MAGFATDVDLGKRRVIASGLRIEISFQIRRMAVGAHRLPALGDAGPVQRIVGLELLANVRWSQIKPRLCCGVPADPQDLKPSDFVVRHVSRSIELDHVLLQRRPAEDVLDLKVLHLAGRSLGVNHEPIAVAIHATGDSIMLERGVVEVAQHRLFGRPRPSPSRDAIPGMPRLLCDDTRCTTGGQQSWLARRQAWPTSNRQKSSPTQPRSKQQRWRRESAKPARKIFHGWTE